MVDFCPNIYVSTESCDIAAYDSIANVQIGTAVTTGGSSTLAESLNGANHMVYDVAVNSDNTKIYAGSGTHYPIVDPIFGPFTADDKNALQSLNPDLTGLTHISGIDLNAYNVLLNNDMTVSLLDDDTLLLLAWTNPPLQLTLFKIDLITESIVQTWSGLSFDSNGNSDFVFGSGGFNQPLLEMEIINSTQVLYTTHGANIFRFNFQTGLQLPAFRTSALPHTGIFAGNTYGALRTCTQGLLVTARYAQYPYSDHPQYQNHWGEILLLDNRGAVQRRYTRDSPLGNADPQVTPGTPFVPMCGIALGENDDIFYSDGVWHGGWLSGLIFGCVLTKWRISTGEFLGLVKLRTSFTFDPVTGMISCQPKIDFNVNKSESFATLIGAT